MDMHVFDGSTTMYTQPGPCYLPSPWVLHKILFPKRAFMRLCPTPQLFPSPRAYSAGPRHTSRLILNRLLCLCGRLISRSL